MVRNEAEEKSDAQYSEHERSTGCSSPHTLGQRSNEKLKNQQHQAPSSNQNILCWTNGSCIETGPSKDTGGYVLYI